MWLASWSTTQDTKDHLECHKQYRVLLKTPCPKTWNGDFVKANDEMKTYQDAVRVCRIAKLQDRSYINYNIPKSYMQLNGQPISKNKYNTNNDSSYLMDPDITNNSELKADMDDV